MDGIIEAFHLDIKLLIAQLINFTIVLAVLYKLVYKPLLKTMNERTSKIEKGLEDAQSSQEQLEKAEKTRDDKIKEAKKEAKELLEKMQVVAEKNKENIIQKAKEEEAIIMENTRKTIEVEKEKMFKEVRQEIGELTGLALEKVLDKKQAKEIDQASIKKAISEIKR